MDALTIALNLIRRFEGSELAAYLDVVGLPTIGYGHRAQVNMGDTCTIAQAEKWLQDDASKVMMAILGFVRVDLIPCELAALISFAFNCGISALQGSTLMRKLNAGDRAGAANEFAAWDHAGGKVIAGLAARRGAERLMFLGETDDAC
jgi:lysozyme